MPPRARNPYRYISSEQPLGCTPGQIASGGLLRVYRQPALHHSYRYSHDVLLGYMLGGLVHFHPSLSQLQGRGFLGKYAEPIARPNPDPFNDFGYTSRAPKSSRPAHCTAHAVRLSPLVAQLAQLATYGN